ncbi:MAG: hypothetical protein GDA56_08960 [Hormoscilla sp. GM7CHS1pb]|nr:hypothetical protein [Hormoscilla sp. GM7CHS1pb]
MTNTNIDRGWGDIGRISLRGGRLAKLRVSASIPIGDLLIYLKDCRRNASPLQIFLHA